MGLTEKAVTDLFNAVVIKLGSKTPNPVISTWLNTEGTFGFIELRSIQDTTDSLGLLQGRC